MAKKTESSMGIGMSSRSVPALHIRWLTEMDLPDVLEIERGSFDDPWTEEEFRKVLRLRNYVGMVAVTESLGIVVGYMVYGLKPGGLELASLAVNPNFRREGIGRQMIAKLVGKLSPRVRKSIDLVVMETNMGAVKFFSQVGFIAIGVLRGFYRETSGEDGYRMVYRVDR